MPQPPVKFYNSLLWRFSALFVAVIAASGLVQLFFSTRGWRELVEHIEQQVNWDLASDIAERIQPEVEHTLQKEKVEALLLSLTISNPKAEYVLLDGEGTILAAIPFRNRLAKTSIGLEPLKRALEPALPALPLYADDPFGDEEKKIFSVSSIVLNDQPGYLFVPLMSSTYDFFVRNTGQFYLVKIIAIGLLCSWLFALTTGLFVFSYLSRRFRLLGQTMESFQGGDYAVRAPLQVDDEISRLSKGFNEMADTISSNTDELRRKDKLRRELVANISHDLRGPVTSTLAHVEALLEKKLSEDERLHYLRIVQENAQAQNRLVEDLFDLSVLEANEGRLDRDFCSLSKIVESVLGALAPLAERKAIHLHSSLPPELPLVFADSRAIQRILSNLISNGIRYTPEKGSVGVTAQVAKDGIHVTIADTGIGIPSDELPLIFDSFYRANKHRPEDPGGTGLGLAIVKQLLLLHGTSPHVESEVDAGSKFSFLLQTDDRSE